MKKALAPLPKCRESYNEMDAVRQKKVDDINCHWKAQNPRGTGTFGPLWIGVLFPAEFGKSSSDQSQGIGLREQWIGSAPLHFGRFIWLDRPFSRPPSSTGPSFRACLLGSRSG